MTEVAVKTRDGDRTVTIPEGWQQIPIEGDSCRSGDRFYNVNEFQFQDAVQSDIGVSSFFFELLIRKKPTPSKRKRK